MSLLGNNFQYEHEAWGFDSIVQSDSTELSMTSVCYWLIMDDKLLVESVHPVLGRRFPK